MLNALQNNVDTLPRPAVYVKTPVVNWSSVPTIMSHGEEAVPPHRKVIRAMLCHLQPGLKWSSRVPAGRGPE